MEIQEDIQLRVLDIDSIEKLIDEFVYSANDCSGLFKILNACAVDENLQQIICNTAKARFEKQMM